MLGRSDWQFLIATSCAVFVLTWVMVEAIRRWALGRRLVDVPNSRSAHSQPTPRLGGAAMAGPITLALLAVAAWLPEGAGLRLVPLVLTAAAVSLISLLDDVRGLPAAVRLTAHVAAAVLIVWTLGGIRTVRFPGFAFLWDLPVGPIALLGWILPVLWLVGFTNAFNFMDGIDGLAGAQALICSVTWIAIGALHREVTLVALGMVTAAAAAGFLLHNWSPARIFMGDAGSTFLGLLLAGAPFTPEMSTPFVTAAILMAWPFIFDTLLTMLRRARRGENLFAAHRSHLYQRLTRAQTARAQARAEAQSAAQSGAQSGAEGEVDVHAHAHTRVVLLYAVLAAVGCVTAVLDLSGRPLLARLGLLALPLAAGALWTLVTWRELATPGDRHA